MRHIIAFALALLLASPVLAAQPKSDQADETAVGGFEGPVRGAQAETVEKAMKLAQDSRVVLTGNIVASVAGEKNQYYFKDATGEMLVTITPKQFKGNIVKPDMKVRLTGKIDKNANAPDTARLRVSQLEIEK